MTETARPEREGRVVAECWTCTFQNHIGRVHRFGMRRCDCPRVPLRLTNWPLYTGHDDYLVKSHRAAGHDVREVRPVALEETP